MTNADKQWILREVVGTTEYYSTQEQIDGKDTNWVLENIALPISLKDQLRRDAEQKKETELLQTYVTPNDCLELIAKAKKELLDDFEKQLTLGNLAPIFKMIYSMDIIKSEEWKKYRAKTLGDNK